MEFGSVCSGIEAASVAFAPLGWKAAWLAEIDVPASAVLAHRLGATAPQYMPDPHAFGITEKTRKERQNAIKTLDKVEWGSEVVNYGDMTVLADLVLSGDAAAPALLCGGTPCQGFSIAGKGKGLKDPRSQLSLSFVELANAIDAVRTDKGDDPCVVIWENVPGIFSDKSNAFGHYLAALAGEDVPIEPPGGKWKNAGAVVGPQRTVAWRVLDAQFFALAQRRARLVVVASAMAGFDPAAILFEFGSLRRDSAPVRPQGQDVASTLTASLGGISEKDRIEGRVVTHAVLSDGVEPDSVTVMAHGQAGAEILRDHSPTLTCNHEAPIAAYALRGISDYAVGKPLLRSKGGDCGGGSEALLVLPFDTTQLTSPFNYSNPQFGDPCHAIAAGAHVPAIVFAAEVAPTLRAGGNETGGDRPPGTDVDTCTSLVVHGTQDPLVLTDLAFPLQGNSGQENAVFVQMVVRRLMPVECERLQGFPDGHTLVPFGNRMMADGPRYKQIGNSWATHVFRWVGIRIARELRRMAIEELC